MDKSAKAIVVTLTAALFVGLGIVEFMGREDGRSPIGQTFKEMVAGREFPPAEASRDVTDKQDASARGRKPAQARNEPVASGAPGTVAVPIAEPAKPIAPVVVVPRPHEPVSRVAPVFAVQQRRSDSFVPGNLRGWIGYGISFEKPLLVRAGGEVRAGEEISGPGGLKDPGGPRRTVGRTGAGTRVSVLPGAPYLALIGRVCSTEECSAPFVVGAHAVLCPSELGVTGDLQLWTNNYVQIDGYQTLASYTSTAGGYRFQAEPAPANACENGAASAAPAPSSRGDGGIPLPDEQALKDPAFVVTSRQNSWKPFFLPLDRAFVIRASGQMQPLERVRATGPNGIIVPDLPRWTYPGAKSVVVDNQHVLLERSLPYQALIGRLCSSKECGEPFLVGAERTICPSSRYSERLELWINHIVPRSERLHLPFASLTFQSRRGEYRFEVSSAPACGG